MPETSNALSPNVVFGSRQLRYPSPFFDIANTKMPPTYKSLFKFCAYYLATNPIVSAAIYRMASYPVTKVIISHKDPKVKRKWEDLLLDKMKIRSRLVEHNLDWFTFGNYFVTPVFPFRRFLRCKKCFALLEMAKLTEYRFSGDNLVGKCPSCHEHTTFKVTDKDVKNLNRIRLVRLNPLQMDIDSIEVTGDTTYSYSVTGTLRRRILALDRQVLERVPWLYVSAAKRNKRVTINQRRVFHAARPTPSNDNDHMGMPLIMPCLRLLYLSQLYFKAREAIAHEHILPLRILYPKETGTVDPVSDMNLSTWADQLEKEIQKWRQDPNYVPIMPIPVGMVFMGGDAQTLSVAADVASVQRDVIAGMMVPLEFIYGGLSFSGSSVSLRMLENDFQNLREQMLDFMNGFLVPLLAKFLDWPVPEITFSDLRTADDVQRQQMDLTLTQAGYQSVSRLLEGYGIDPESEFQLMHDELEKVSKILEEKAKSQARAQGEMGLVAMDYQIRQQIKALVRQSGAGQEMQEAMGGASEEDVAALTNQLIGSNAFAPADGGTAPSGASGIGAGTDQASSAAGAMGRGQSSGNMDARTAMSAFAGQLFEMPAKDRNAFLKGLAKTSPAVSSTLEEMLAQFTMGGPPGSSGKSGVDMKAGPKQKPERRAKKN